MTFPLFLRRGGILGTLFVAVAALLHDAMTAYAPKEDLFAVGIIVALCVLLAWRRREHSPAVPPPATGGAGPPSGRHPLLSLLGLFMAAAIAPTVIRGTTPSWLIVMLILGVTTLLVWETAEKS